MRARGASTQRHPLLLGRFLRGNGLLGRALLLGILNIALLGGLAGCGEPFIVFPGGQLDGNLSAAPALWSEVPETIDIESRPEDPYSVIVWAVGVGPDLYVATSGDGTNWTRHFEDNARMRARIGDDLFELQAVKVEDPTEMARVLAAYETKYDIEPADFSTGIAYRLDRR